MVYTIGLATGLIVATRTDVSCKGDPTVQLGITPREPKTKYHLLNAKMEKERKHYGNLF